jgi:hypothetical protein
VPTTTSTTNSPSITDSSSTDSPTITPTTSYPTIYTTPEPSITFQPTYEPTYESTKSYTFWDSTMISVITVFSIMSCIGLVSFGYYVFHYFYTEPSANDVERRPLMERIKRRANPV